MVDVFTPKKRSQIMKRIRSKNTGPEIRLRRALHALGLRYRLHVKGLPGKPDIVLPKFKAVIQVRGCFWHGHDCIDGHVPKSRQDYWKPKLERNKIRDAQNDSLLIESGWDVIVVWGCLLNSASSVTREAEKICRKIAYLSNKSISQILKRLG